MVKISKFRNLVKISNFRNLVKISEFRQNFIIRSTFPNLVKIYKFHQNVVQNEFWVEVKQQRWGKGVHPGRIAVWDEVQFFQNSVLFFTFWSKPDFIPNWTSSHWVEVRFGTKCCFPIFCYIFSLFGENRTSSQTELRPSGKKSSLG